MVRTLPARGSGAAATTCPRGVRGVVDHPHGQLRSLATPLDDRLLLCLNLCGRLWVATVRPRCALSAASSSAISSDRSSWLRLPPLMRAAPQVLAETTVACTNAYRKRVTAVCRCYFPLEHIVFFVFLASEKFPPRLRGEEGFKHARGAHNTHRRRLKLR